MNSIATEQNSDRQLQRLAAQRQLYSTAKGVFGVQVLLGGPVAVGLALLSAAYPAAKGYTALWGMLIAIADLIWLTPWQKNLRETAARVQEQFDCDVLSLAWNRLKAGSPPEPELVLEQSEKYAKWATKMPPLRDWYAPQVAELPLHIGRLACQRSNCWWDSKQRRRYAWWIIGTVAAVFVAILYIAMADDMTISKLVIEVAAPLAPLLLLGTRQFWDNREAAARLVRLQEHAERLWTSALGGRSESDMTTESRGLQDEILENRRRSPLVFDGIYSLLRRGYEAQMQFGVAEFVLEAKKRLGP